jgi:hypothetical protein
LRTAVERFNGLWPLLRRLKSSKTYLIAENLVSSVNELKIAMERNLVSQFNRAVPASMWESLTLKVIQDTEILTHGSMQILHGINDIKIALAKQHDPVDNILRCTKDSVFTSPSLNLFKSRIPSPAAASLEEPKLVGLWMSHFR